jgi:phage FluMu gp28-like protein
VRFCREWLFFEPYEYMWPFLRDGSHFVALVQARQTGKTFNGMAKLLWLALRYPGSRILVTAPKLEQAKNIAFRALAEHLARMKVGDPELFRMVCGGSRRILHTVIRLRNGSTLLAQPPVPETIRGHTAKAVYLMEANFIAEDEELYPAVLFALNTTGGYLIAESTPWNRESVFYRMMHDAAYSGFSRYVVPYTEALAPRGPLNPGMVTMIEGQLRGDSARWRREMLCEWGEDADAWLPIALIALAQDSAIDYVPATARPVGEFHVGVDFGKHRDPSVVAVVERLGGHLFLRHMHAFPLETSYGAVIGYIKRLQDNWTTIRSVYADKTGVGDYIVEDMQRGGIRNVAGVSFTDQSKEAMATALKEQMRKAACTKCSWSGYVDTQNGEWRTTCPSCSSGLRPFLHIPYDAELFHELNVERYELVKTGRLLFNHPTETHDDRFWALTLSVFSAESITRIQKPIAKILY